MLKKLFIILFILSFSLLAFALDDEGETNDPTTNDRANACYDPGRTCTTNWDWEAGWYFIRFEYGMISRENFPPQYAVVLPALPEDVEAAAGAGAGCQSGPSDYLFFGPGNFVPSGSPVFMDAACTTPTGGVTGSAAFVWASTPTEANNICIAHGFDGANPVRGNLHHCHPF